MEAAFPAMRLPAVRRLVRRISLLALLVSAPALAQQQNVLVPVGSASHEVVQPLPPQGTGELDEALKRLAVDSRDSAALIRAGDASLKLNDVDAAIGFYTRAQALGATGGEAKAGLAAAQVYRKMPVEALRLFDEAERAGVSRATHASDHGLAYDLVGDNAHAQEYYRLALQLHPDDETTRRLALSEAIGGDQNASERTLLPLLQHRDLASYRTRAFALAALGKADEAVSIADTMMSASLAGRIAPYLRYMPRLTKAQQAAAANFGHFPEANAIGRDDARIAAYAARTNVASAAPIAGEQRLVPSGAPLGTAKPVPTQTFATNTAAAKAQTRSRVSTFSPPPRSAETTANLSTAPAAKPIVAQMPKPVTAAPGTVTQTPRPAFAVAAAQPAPINAAPANAGFDLNEVPANKTGAIEVSQVEHSTPVPPSAPAPTPAVSKSAPPPPESLEQAFAEFETVKTSAKPSAGAVDVTAIKPTRAAPPPKPEPVKAKPAKPKNPSRIWVQVATGGNRKALGRDWERIAKKAPKEFKRKDGYLVDWGRTNRLVTGPFPDEDKAQDFIGELKKSGLSTFMFTSDDGEEVVPLPGE